tara:strand:- start:2471 stop:4135 length:1665 start_codon:yes stop_codon:yes gene_type:complete
MGKISNTTSYPFGTPVDNDYVIGTESITGNKETQNFKLGDIAGLDPVDTLGLVLQAGNVSDAPILGTGESAIILQNGGVTQLQLNPRIGFLPGNGDIIAAGDVSVGGYFSLIGEFKDSLGGSGTAGQVLKSKGPGMGIEWLDDSQPSLTAQKFWYGAPGLGLPPLESTNILNDETGTGELYLGQIPNGLTMIDNYLLARVLHPVGDNNLSYGLLALSNAAAAAIENTAIGVRSLIGLSTGSYNTAVGYEAGGSLSTSRFNTAIGVNALSGAAGDGNTAVGRQALQITRGVGNTAVGIDSLSSVGTAEGNTALGSSTGISISLGRHNIVVGDNTGGGITTQSYNVVVGNQAMTLPAGEEGIAIGRRANGNSGNFNIGIGTDAMTPLGGAHNEAIAIGFRAMARGGANDIAIGTSTIATSTGGNNIAIGTTAFNALIGAIPRDNVAIGTEALNNPAIDLGSRNVAIGFQAQHNFPNAVDSIGLGSAVLIQRTQEFRLSDSIRDINLGTGFSSQASNIKVFPDNATALGVLLPGDLYVLGPLGALPPGQAAQICIVY